MLKTDSCFRRNLGLWIPACAGMTLSRLPRGRHVAATGISETDLVCAIVIDDIDFTQILVGYLLAIR